MADGPRLAIDAGVRVGTLALDVRLEVPPGPTLLVGPNGAGKSSLLRLVAGALRPTRGHVRLGDRTLVEAPGRGLPPEARGLAYLPQDYGLFPHLSALDNVAFGVRGAAGRAARRARARTWLEELGVADAADARPAALSGGQRQRVALARALATAPDALLLDEPLAALDVVRKDAVRSFLVAHLRALPFPSLVVTHDPADLQAFDAPLVVLDQGRVVFRGDLASARADPPTELLAALLGR